MISQGRHTVIGEGGGYDTPKFQKKQNVLCIHIHLLLNNRYIYQDDEKISEIL